MKTTHTPIWISILLFFFYINISRAQVTTTISAGASWTDATLTKSLNLPSEAYLQTTNYNSYPRIDATAWTHSSQQITYRNLLRFDLTAIPVNATIQSANLFLYSDPTATSGPGSNTGTNAFFLQKVTTAWNPTAVTWDTQPTSTTVNRVYVPASASATENITVSLTSMIQDMVLNPGTNFGMMMLLENEITYESRNYASSDHANTAIRPKIVITYTLPVSMAPQDSLALVALYNNTNGNSWTNKTNWLNGRASNWYGVSSVNGRVTNVNLPNNNLSGSLPNAVGNLSQLKKLFLQGNSLTGIIPASIGGITTLDTLQLQNNQFTSIPDFSGNINKANITLLVENNKIDFSSLEPIFNSSGIPIIKNLRYSPQQSSILKVDLFSNKIISAIGGLNNQYRWYKDGVLLNSPLTSSYFLLDVEITGSSVFKISTTNSKVPNLTITSDPLAISSIISASLPCPNATSYKDKMDCIFSSLNKSQVPTQILYNRVNPIAGLHVFGQNGRRDTSSYNHLVQSEADLYNSSYATNLMPDPTIFRDMIRKNTLNNSIPIGLLYYDFNVIDTLAIDNNTLQSQNNLISNVSGNTASPFQNRRVLVSAPLLERVPLGQATFKIPSDLIWTNINKTISNVQVTGGDGNQSIILTPDGSPMALNFTTNGNKPLEIKINFADNTQLTTYAVIKVGQ